MVWNNGILKEFEWFLQKRESEGKMQEFNDGTFGEIKEAQELLKLLETPDELKNTKAIHFGTKEELEKIKQEKTKGAFGSTAKDWSTDDKSVKEYLREIDMKLDLIIKHFNIVYIL